MRKALEQQEMSPTMSLCRLSLRGRHLCPLIRALKLQSSLRQLHLSGNLLGDAEAEELLSMLGTMPKLTHLNLACNRLTHEGIRKLVPAPGTPDYTALQVRLPLRMMRRCFRSLLNGVLSVLLEPGGAGPEHEPAGGWGVATSGHPPAPLPGPELPAPAVLPALYQVSAAVSPPAGQRFQRYAT